MRSREELLSVLKRNMSDDYEIGELDFLEEYEIGIGVLFEEIYELFEAGGGLMISEQEIVNIARRRKNSVEYDVIKSLYRTSKKELNQIIIGKEQTIISLIMMFMQSGLDEVEEMYGFAVEDIAELTETELFHIVRESLDYIMEVRNEVEDMNPFYEMANKINQLLDEAL